jgi:CRP-like cAMP-binding protein
MEPSGNGQQQVRRLKKGELLFKEGDLSRSMYLIKSGMIRLFLKKGDSNVEIDTIRAGQILGELAFLDGNPRSLSGEALTECELVEISGSMFAEVIGKAPEWLKILLKTVVGRLRAANTRIRQLEAANTAIDYSDKDGGKRTTVYQYISLVETMKILTAFIVVASRKGVKTPEGIDIDMGLVNRYSNSIMGVPVAKNTCVVDLLVQNNLAVAREEKGSSRVFLKDLDFIEKLNQSLIDENLKDPSKRHDVSSRGFLIMGMIAAQLPKLQKDPKTGRTTVNLAPLKKTADPQKEAFRNEEVGELIRLGYCSELQLNSPTEVLVTANSEEFSIIFRFVQILQSLKAINDQKKKVSGASK